ncbi:uncharacterized protein LOC115361311 [Myripristis murdjan]|uniref:uncharacterized protein LOC115361311 n=1 Tax=Myripristis murdjan TaxID=586833 RepID=UPI001175E81C|nr:uncharacterized protein LOC115361311 [Myripristis murdjan]
MAEGHQDPWGTWMGPQASCEPAPQALPPVSSMQHQGLPSQLHAVPTTLQEPHSPATPGPSHGHYPPPSVTATSGATMYDPMSYHIFEAVVRKLPWRMGEQLRELKEKKMEARPAQFHCEINHGCRSLSDCVRLLREESERQSHRHKLLREENERLSHRHKLLREENERLSHRHKLLRGEHERLTQYRSLLHRNKQSKEEFERLNKEHEKLIVRLSWYKRLRVTSSLPDVIFVDKATQTD